MAYDYHTPVLTNTVLSFLQPNSDGIYVDATLGGGGHAESLLRASAPSGRVIGFDADEEALQYAKGRLNTFADRVQFVHDNFSHMTAALALLQISRVDGILFDLGVSSRQIDSPERGFGFREDQPLDMRMDRRQGADARNVLNTYDEKTLADIFWKFGEEKNSRRIAREIVRARLKGPIASTAQLAGLVESSVGGKFLTKSLARIFQAIRIEVNQELVNLGKALDAAASLLKTGGRLVVLSYHSLEDRMVKEFIREKSRTVVPSGHKYIADLPRTPELVALTKKPVVASEAERGSNPRSRSAKLRAAEKC
jgi:16S rRNA (cytosine1402-N4)-methyltransferase